MDNTDAILNKLMCDYWSTKLTIMPQSEQSLYLASDWFGHGPDFYVRAACAFHGMPEVLFAARRCDSVNWHACALAAANNANIEVLESLKALRVPIKWSEEVTTALARSGNIEAIKRAITHAKAKYDADLPLAAFEAPLTRAADVIALLDYLTSLPDTINIAGLWAPEAACMDTLCDAELKTLFATLMDKYGDDAIDYECLNDLILGNMFETAAFVLEKCPHIELDDYYFLAHACEADNIQAMEWLMARGCVPHKVYFAVATLGPTGAALRLLHQKCPHITLGTAYYSAVAYGRTTAMCTLYELGYRASDTYELRESLYHLMHFDRDTNVLRAVLSFLLEHGLKALPDMKRASQQPCARSGYVNIFHNPYDDSDDSDDSDDDASDDT